MRVEDSVADDVALSVAVLDSATGDIEPVSETLVEVHGESEVLAVDDALEVDDPLRDGTAVAEPDVLVDNDAMVEDDGVALSPPEVVGIGSAVLFVDGL